MNRIVRNSMMIVAVLLGILGVLLLAFTTDDPGEHRLFFGLWRMRHFLPGVACLITGPVVLIASRSKPALFRTIAVVGSSVLCLAVLEAVGAVGLASYPALLDREQSPLGTLPLPNADLRGVTYMDIATLWGLGSEPIDFHYQTNALGYRNLPGRDAADIYVVGDSIIVSCLLPYEDTLSARLERRTDRPVMNIGLIAISVAREQELFRQARLPLDDRLVLQFVFEGNDVADAVSDRDGPAAPKRASLVRRTLTYNLLMKLQRISQPVVGIAPRRTGRIGDQEYIFLWAEESFRGHEIVLSTIQENLKGLGEEVRAAGGRYGIVYIPSKLRVLGPVAEFPPDSDFADLEPHLNPIREQLSAWAAREGLPLLDLTVPLQEAAAAGRIPWFWGDTHLNAIGHEIMADHIADWDLVREGFGTGDVPVPRDE